MYRKIIYNSQRQQAMMHNADKNQDAHKKKAKEIERDGKKGYKNPGLLLKRQGRKGEKKQETISPLSPIIFPSQLFFKFSISTPDAYEYPKDYAAYVLTKKKGRREMLLF
jgi:hypothetical protein